MAEETKEKAPKASRKSPKASEKAPKMEGNKVKIGGVERTLPEFLRGKCAVAHNLDFVKKLMVDGFEGAVICSRAVYDEIPAIRQSDFKKYLTKAMYFPLEKKYPPERPAHFRDGSLFDALLFDQPEEVAEKFIIGPDVHRNTNIWKDFVAANKGKEIFKPDEYKQIEYYRDSFVEHPHWKNFIALEHAFQVVFLRKHHVSGIWMKAMCDSINPEMIVDAKLLEDASFEAFRRTYIGSFGYDIQSAWYRYCSPIPGIRFVFACQEKHGYPEKVLQTTQWFTPADEDVMTAMRVIDKQLGDFAAALESGKFPGYTDQLITVKALPYQERLG